MEVANPFTLSLSLHCVTLGPRGNGCHFPHHSIEAHTFTPVLKILAFEILWVRTLSQRRVLPHRTPDYK